MRTRSLSYLSILLFVVSSTVVAQIPAGYKEISCTMKPMADRAKNLSHPHIPAPQTKKTLPKNQATSTNWSGYVAANNLSHPSNNTVSSVAGSWIVPTVARTSNAYCAYWVGIDGYSSSTVEQIGTAHDMVNGAQQHYAWFEMYPGGSYQITGFPVSPGDVISASVVYVGNGVFSMTLANNTQSVATTIPTSYTRSTTATRSSAEWIVEAPFSGSILPLSNFGTAYMWGCNATINSILAPISNNNWQSASLDMVTNSNALKALTSSLLPDAGSFFILWSHS